MNDWNPKPLQPLEPEDAPFDLTDEGDEEE